MHDISSHSVDLFGWAPPGRPVDAICVTTNGNVNRHGEAVMGAGCALEAKTRWPGLAKDLGHRLDRDGNHVYAFNAEDYDDNLRFDWLVTFPVKHDWDDNAVPALIVASAGELIALTRALDWRVVLLPRPGCGNGNLDWDRQVRPILEPILDDRFYVLDNPAKRSRRPGPRRRW
jgi:hypothetical protein